MLLFATGLLFGLHSGWAESQLTPEWLDKPVTIQFHNESLSKVLEKISKLTGIAIFYDQQLADEKVTGSYKDVKTSEAINRLFSGKNKSIQVGKNEKYIIVKTFGAKKFIRTGPEQPGDNTNKLTLGELKTLHTQQYKEYKESIANDNEILEGIMTRAELRAMHAQQYKEYEKRKANDNEVLEGGMTRGQLKAMHAQQYKEYEKRKANDNEVLEGGMTRGQLKALHAQQYKEYEKHIANDNEILEGGMTRGQLRAMHAQQYKNHQESIHDDTIILH